MPLGFGCFERLNIPIPLLLVCHDSLTKWLGCQWEFVRSLYSHSLIQEEKRFPEILRELRWSIVWPWIGRSAWMWHSDLEMSSMADWGPGRTNGLCCVNHSISPETIKQGGAAFPCFMVLRLQPGQDLSKKKPRLQFH